MILIIFLILIRKDVSKMFKNILIFVLIFIILAGAFSYWYIYIKNPVIDPPINTFAPTVTETPIPTITP